VVSPVLDRLVAHPGVDARRIALLGISMGGMLAPRAAAFDPRISAVIACDGVYDMFDFAVGLIPLPREEAAARIAAESDVGLDELLDEVIEHNSVARWSTDHGRWCFGAPSSRAFLAMLRDYHLKDGIAERISCPTLVMKAERDFAFPGQPELLYQHLHCNKALVEFTIDEGAGAHCHFGGMTLACARMLDWLDHVFKAR
jgi:pimeloyl-ACP methyl ester carboxylesterase